MSAADELVEAVEEMMVVIGAHVPGPIPPVLLPPEVYRRAEAEGINLDGYACGADWPEPPPIADLVPPGPRNRAERRAEARRR